MTLKKFRNVTVFITNVVLSSTIIGRICHSPITLVAHLTSNMQYICHQCTHVCCHNQRGPHSAASQCMPTAQPPNASPWCAPSRCTATAQLHAASAYRQLQRHTDTACPAVLFCAVLTMPCGRHVLAKCMKHIAQGAYYTNNTPAIATAQSVPSPLPLLWNRDNHVYEKTERRALLQQAHLHIQATTGPTGLAAALTCLTVKQSFSTEGRGYSPS